MDFIDDINAVVPPERREFDVLADLPDIIDTGIRGAVDLDHVYGRALGDLRAVRAGVTRAARRALFTVEGLGQDPGDRGLPDAACTGKQERVSDAFGRNGVHQRLDDVPLANHIVEGPGAIFSG